MIGTRERARMIAAHVDAGDLREHHVEEHERGPRRVESRDRLRAVGRRLDEEPLALERDRERIAVRLLVVDHEDERRISHYETSDIERVPPFEIGTCTVNFEPSPSRDSTVTSPPCAWATWRTIARPEPGAAGLATPRAVHAVEALEDAFEIAGRDTDAVIAHDERDAVTDDLGADLDRLPRPGVLDRVVEQVHQRAAHLTPVARELDVGRLRGDDDRNVGEVGRGLHEIDRLGEQETHGNRRTGGGLLRLDLAQVEEIVDDARQTIGFAHHAVGELLHDVGVVGRRHRLGEQPERPDRRLQLVTHVRHEVAPDALDAPRLRDVTRERDRAHDLAVAPKRERSQLEHLAGRAVELELALRRDAVERGAQELVDGVLGEHLAVARAVEPAGRCVAHDLTPDAIDDDDRVGCLVERGQQPVLHGLGARDPIGRLPSRLRDRVDERHVVRHVCRFAGPAQLAAVLASPTNRPPPP